MDMVLPTIAGLIIGVATSWMFWRYLLWVKPKVVLSPKVSVTFDRTKGKKVYRFKIVNTGRHQAINITLRAWVADLMKVPGGEVSRAIYEMPINNSQTATLNPEKDVKRPWGLTSETTLRSEPDRDIEGMLEDCNTIIMVTLRVSDAISGTTIVQQRTYSRADIVRGMFKIGRSFEIVALPEE